MKTKVFHDAIDRKKISIEAFRLMMDAGIEFTIKPSFYGLRKFFYQAQQNVLPIGRRSTFGTGKREAFIKALNYRWTRYQADIEAKNTPTVTQPTVTQPEVIHLTSAMKKAAELGAFIRAMGPNVDTETKAAFIAAFMA